MPITAPPRRPVLLAAVAAAVTALLLPAGPAHAGQAEVDLIRTVATTTSEGPRLTAQFVDHVRFPLTGDEGVATIQGSTRAEQRTTVFGQPIASAIRQWDRISATGGGAGYLPAWRPGVPPASTRYGVEGATLTMSSEWVAITQPGQVGHDFAARFAWRRDMYLKHEMTTQFEYGSAGTYVLRATDHHRLG